MKIGYIYRYNEKEEKGILVYGNTLNKPIIFYRSNCISDIRTGQLAYFEQEDSASAYQIERASLCNFKREIVNNIISECNSLKLDECNKATTIRYVDLESIDFIKTPETIKEVFKLFESKYHLLRRIVKVKNIDNKVPESIDELFLLFEKKYYLQKKAVQSNNKLVGKRTPKVLNLLYILFESQYCLLKKGTRNISDKNVSNCELPETIDDLYELFKIQEHISFDEDSNTCSIHILDIALWLDTNVLMSDNLYGKTAEQVIDLFELFANKWIYAREYTSSKTISPSWKCLLAILNNDDLMVICKNVRMLQPALPREFCFKNLDALSIDYGFPSIPICEAYFRNRIKGVMSTVDYKFLLDKLDDAMCCTAKLKDNEGVSLCNIKKRVLREMTETLEKKFQTVVLDNLKYKLTSISSGKIDGESKITCLIISDKDYVLKLGNFIDKYETVIGDYEYLPIKRYVEAYNDLSDEDKKLLRIPFTEIGVLSVKRFANSVYRKGKAQELMCILRFFSGILDSKDIAEIKSIVNSEFAKLNDLEELEYAFSGDMISEKQCFIQYKLLTKDYDLNRLLVAIWNNSFTNIPLSIQEYLIREIIHKFDFKNLNSYKDVKLDYDSINNMEGLIGWFNGQFSLNSELLNRIVKEMTDNLNKEDRWYLFDKGLIPSPSYDNIREKLDEAYNHYSKVHAFSPTEFDFGKHHKIEDELFQKDCFQEVMVDDIFKFKEDNYDKVFLILKALSKKHREQIKTNKDPKLLFFVWVIAPDENVDFYLFEQYFYLLPKDVQIRTFRYLFYLKATKCVDFSVPKLRQVLTGFEKHTICKPLEVILFLLEKKVNDLFCRITNKELRMVSDNEKALFHEEPYNENSLIQFPSFYYQKWSFRHLRDFFYECYGYLSLAAKDFDTKYYHSIGKIEAIENEGGSFFVISFYKRPIHFLGDYVDHLDDEYVVRAKASLEQNIPYKLIDGRYWVSTDYRADIKELVLEHRFEDCCKLFAFHPIFANYCIKRYEASKSVFCKKNRDCRGEDPKIRMSFCWCDKRPCTRLGKFFTPTIDWEKYKFADFLNIFYQGDQTVHNAIWNAEAEISAFLNSFIANPREESDSSPIIIDNEIGEWTDTMSIVSDNFPDDDFDEDEVYEINNDYDADNHREESTYGRYSGSYAQDEMGFSDDDIDTIFDGEPDAYWNID